MAAVASRENDKLYIINFINNRPLIKTQSYQKLSDLRDGVNEQREF